MAKNIKIIPSKGIIELSGATSSTIDLGHKESTDELKFSGASGNPVRLDVTGGYSYNSDSIIQVEADGEVYSKGLKRIDKGGVWQGPPAQNKGIKGLKGLKGSSAPASDQGPTGSIGIQGPQGATQGTGSQGGLGPTGGQGLIGNKGIRGDQGPIGTTACPSPIDTTRSFYRRLNRAPRCQPSQDHTLQRAHG